MFLFSLVTFSSISKNCQNLHLTSEFVLKPLLLEQTAALVKGERNRERRKCHVLVQHL